MDMFSRLHAIFHNYCSSWWIKNCHLFPDMVLMGVGTGEEGSNYSQRPSRDLPWICMGPVMDQPARCLHLYEECICIVSYSTEHNAPACILGHFVLKCYKSIIMYLYVYYTNATRHSIIFMQFYYDISQNFLDCWIFLDDWVINLLQPFLDKFLVHLNFCHGNLKLQLRRKTPDIEKQSIKITNVVVVCSSYELLTFKSLV